MKNQNPETESTNTSVYLLMAELDRNDTTPVAVFESFEAAEAESQRLEGLLRELDQMVTAAQRGCEDTHSIYRHYAPLTPMGSLLRYTSHFFVQKMELCK